MGRKSRFTTDKKLEYIHITELCKLAEIQRSSYYKWLNRKENINEKFNKELIPLIKDAYRGKKWNTRL